MQQEFLDFSTKLVDIFIKNKKSLNYLIINGQIKYNYI
ncbi:hypothetical protein VAMP_112n47 [Candidatus Vampirococcus lugosii]|uniref:Uncharacterized protein n=1 Tax=Candidatus Vampirococcus lugosii TaxID=2789015 RepID=A0ABS5QLL3_9BACT|nr:hypothetical protein [Candidatus Vampirococcus lugosii]